MKTYVAYGPGYFGDHDSLDDAFATVARNRGGSVYVHMDVVRALDAQLSQRGQEAFEIREQLCHMLILLRRLGYVENGMYHSAPPIRNDNEKIEIAKMIATARGALNNRNLSDIPDPFSDHVHEETP